MRETARQPITGMLCSARFLYLACEISKRQPIQFALQERNHIDGFSLLPPPQEVQAILTLIANNIPVHAQ